MIIRYTILFSAIICLPAFATVINIPDDYPTIQEGIDASTDGDTVLVQPGTYVENINFNGHNIVLGSLFLTTGDTTYISETIIDGDSSGSVVTFESHEDSTTIITGFTVYNGHANWGGGIYCRISSPIISYNKITLNSVAEFGGGIYCSNAVPKISNNVISFNSAALIGGGILIDYYSDPVISNNTIRTNSAQIGAGAYCSMYSNPSLINTIFTNNYATVTGGALFIISSDPIISNTICWADSAGVSGNEIYIASGNPVITYCDIQGGVEGNGNIDVDPLFRNMENGDYHLMSIECEDPENSPCIDAGNPTIADSLMGCSWGLGARWSDIGAYGGGISMDYYDHIIDIPDDFPTIQQGIDASIHGDTVLVQPGTYVENINFNGHNIVLGSLFLTTGDVAYLSSTIIDGGTVGSVISIINQEDNSTVITGFTIQNGFSDNGAAFQIFQSSPVIENNIIENNIAARGGGAIDCFHANPHIIKNIIRNNSATYKGGAIYCSFSDATISQNVIVYNLCELYGGGIACYFSNSLIINNIFYRNRAPLGGGIACWGVSHPEVINTILWNNVPYQIYVDGPANPNFTYCDIQNGWPGTGNIVANPKFRNSGNYDFRLKSSDCGYSHDSPCIDAGSPAIIDSLLECSWGLGTTLSDMGAYGGGDSVTVGIDFPDIPSPEEFSISQNYPNPFNAMTVIRYSLPEPSEVAIDIYDILGRKIETLVNERQPAGYHQAVWDAIDKSSGIFFFRIQAGDHSETRKMMLLK